MTEVEQLENVIEKLYRLEESLRVAANNLSNGQIVGVWHSLGRHRQEAGDIRVDVQRSITRLKGETVEHSTVG